MLYRIYTEDKDNLARLTNVYFNNFTILKGRGYWHGLGENCAVIEIVTEAKELVYDVANGIKLVNNQEAVLVLETTLNNEVLI